MMSGSKTPELHSLELRLMNPGGSSRLLGSRAPHRASPVPHPPGSQGPLPGGGSYPRMPRPLSFPVSRGEQGRMRLRQDHSLAFQGVLAVTLARAALTAPGERSAPTGRPTRGRARPTHPPQGSRPWVARPLASPIGGPTPSSEESAFSNNTIFLLGFYLKRNIQNVWKIQSQRK